MGAHISHVWAVGVGQEEIIELYSVQLSTGHPFPELNDCISHVLESFISGS